MPQPICHIHLPNIPNFGKAADALQCINFDKSVVKLFINKPKENALEKSAAMSLVAASKLLELKPNTIYELVDGGHLEKFPDTISLSLNRKSVLAFSKKYTLLPRIASTEKTSPRHRVPPRFRAPFRP